MEGDEGLSAFHPFSEERRISGTAGEIISMHSKTDLHIWRGSVVIETIFGWRGMGALMVEAMLNQDYHLMQGYVLWGAGAYILANLAADIICLYLDPRQRKREGSL